MTPQRLTLATVIVAVLAVAALIVVPRLGGARAVEGLDLTGQPSLGSADAPVEVVLFEDFRCPHCATFTEQVFPRIRSEYVDTGQVRVYYVNFPVIQNAEVPALAGECVYQQSNSAFWEFKSPMYRSQGELGNRRRVLELAQTYAPGIDTEALERCFEEEEAIEEVNRDAAMARSLGLTGTPSVIVDGQQVTNTSYEGVKRAIDEALGEG